MTFLFQSILKTAKVVPVFKRDLKLDCCNYRTIIKLSNIDKIIKQPMNKRLYFFLNNNNVIYNSQLCFGIIVHLMS